MNLVRALELIKIEKQCIERNKKQQCDRQCEACDLVQKTNDLLEAYEAIIDFVSTNM